MKILNWNIRVAAHKGSIHQVRELIRNYHLDILMETKINSIKANCIIKKFYYPYFIGIPPIWLVRSL